MPLSTSLHHWPQPLRTFPASVAVRKALPPLRLRWGEADEKRPSQARGWGRSCPRPHRPRSLALREGEAARSLVLAVVLIPQSQLPTSPSPSSQ